MANPQEELDALRAQVAALTARVPRLEQSAAVTPPVAQAPVTAAPTAAPPPPPPPVQPIQPKQVVPGPEFLTKPVIPPGRDSGDLEGKIGKVWANRIGIVAILFGVTYFIMYAFDKGW